MPSPPTTAAPSIAGLRPIASPMGPPKMAPGIQPKKTSELPSVTNSRGTPSSPTIDASRSTPDSVPNTNTACRLTMSTTQNMVP